jgi:hypothetical protein
VILTLAALGVQPAKVLLSRSGSVMNLSNFSSGVLVQLRDMELIQRFSAGTASTWGLTRDGERMAERLSAMDPARMVPEAEATPAPEPVITTVATPRGIGSTEPMPRGEFRCARPGAYDYERWPSRQGNTRVYRDGRHEPVVD